MPSLVFAVNISIDRTIRDISGKVKTKVSGSIGTDFRMAIFRPQILVSIFFSSHIFRPRIFSVRLGWVRSD